MKRLISLFLFILFISLSLQAQLSLDQCQSMAEANYPMIRQYDLIKKAEAYNLSNANKGYLPQITLLGKATYQSEVTHIPLPDELTPLFQMPTLTKDQYGASIEVTQTIWDGGVIKAQKAITQKSTEADLAQLQVHIYTLRERVNQLFFGILLLNEQLSLNQFMEKDLQIQWDKLKSWVEKGVANNTDLNIIEVNKLNIKQQTIELENTREAYIRMLSAMVGHTIEPSTTFIEPIADQFMMPKTNLRPELQLYDRQAQLLEQQKQMLQAKNLPKFGLFVQGSGGKPGLNMLSNDFQFYYIGGIRVSWNIGQLYTKRDERRLLENSLNQISVQRDLFLYNTHQEVLLEEGQIRKYRRLMEDDDRMVSLRRNIRLASEFKAQEGVISVNDMMRDYNAEQQAMQNRVIHKIQLLTHIYRLKCIVNQ